MRPTEDSVRAALRAVEEPHFALDVVSLGLVRTVSISRGRVTLTLAEPLEDWPRRDELIGQVTDAVAAVDGVKDVEVTVEAMDDDDRAALRHLLIGDPEASAGSQQAHGHAEGRSIPFAEPGSTTRVLLIASGKGGVGKSSVTTNLAIALADRGHRTSVVDADVWGFSIPRMLGVGQPPVVVDTMLIPPESYGVRSISMGYFAPDDQAVIWRGPMLHKALEQFLTDVYWGEPDFLLVDLPPGTGDISISLAGFMPRSEVFIVTTPQPAAQRVAARTAAMADKVNLEVRGVIENMSWFTGDDGRRYEIFGAGGGADLADRLGVPLVGQVPLVPALREGGDVGTPIVATGPDSDAARAFVAMAERIDTEMAPTKRYHRELKIV
jgi:ATP-binding protein involved in chromosome partitioning